MHFSMEGQTSSPYPRFIFFSHLEGCFLQFGREGGEERGGTVVWLILSLNFLLQTQKESMKHTTKQKKNIRQHRKFFFLFFSFVKKYKKNEEHYFTNKKRSSTIWCVCVCVCVCECVTACNPRFTTKELFIIILIWIFFKSRWLFKFCRSAVAINERLLICIEANLIDTKSGGNWQLLS